ncbi:unnamed protein product [Candidula unifasciata]|uniref:C2H2-type domain-containing protein n=1 Tax=Candidula unifasciata TaxID=100452 RepID=A0A8S3Z6M9_9EUPU|nr:unnamed protein product [Candidula unifasciata]
MDRGTPNNSNNNVNTGDNNNNMNTISIGSVGLTLPVTSGMDPNSGLSSGTVTGTISVPCSAGDAIAQHQGGMQAQPQHIQIPGTAMSIGSLAVAMGLSGAGSDPNSLTFTSHALASLTARMGLSSMAGTNTGGLMAAGNSLMTFPGNTALNIVPGVGMGPAGVNIVDGSGLSMTVAGGLTMQAPANLSVIGVQTSNDLANANSILSAQQQQQQQQQGHAGGAILQNNVHINAGGSLVNNMGGSLGGSSSAGHASGACCGGCRTRVTVKDQASQTDLSTVIQPQVFARPARVSHCFVPPYEQDSKFIAAADIVKAEERLARSGLMPGARLISHSPSATVSHVNPISHHGPNFPCSCDFCGRMFAKKEYLRRHIRIHTGERPYKCVICGHSFRRSHHLRRHEMTHTGEKPYACTECGKAFTRKQHLDRHYKTHTGEYHRTFKCPFCEKMFFRAHHRDKHMKRHVLTTPDLTAAAFSPVGNLNLSIRRDGTLQADGLNSSPISVASKEHSHSSDDYLTSDEEGKVPDSNKPKEGSKKRKGTSPMRLRFPYDYSGKDGPEGMKSPSMDMIALKNMAFPLPHGVPGPSHGPGLPMQTSPGMTTPTRGRPRGSKNRGGGTSRGKKKAENAELISHLALEMKPERMDLDREGYGGVKKDDEMMSGMYGGKTIPNIPQQFVSESVVVRHPLQVGSPHTMGQQQQQQQQLAGLGGEKVMSIKQDESTPGPVPTPTPTPTPDGRGAPLQWQHQQMGLNPAGGNGSGADYMPGMNRQLHTPGPAAGVNSGGNNSGTTGDVQQTMHYKPPSTPDQNMHHSWAAAGNWPRLTLASDAGTNSYNQVDASRFMNIYGASKVMEMRMADLRGPQNFDGSHWNQGRRDQGQDKGDNRIYTMHQ